MFSQKSKDFKDPWDWIILILINVLTQDYIQKQNSKKYLKRHSHIHQEADRL